MKRAQYNDDSSIAQMMAVVVVGRLRWSVTDQLSLLRQSVCLCVCVSATGNCKWRACKWGKHCCCSSLLLNPFFFFFFWRKNFVWVLPSSGLINCYCHQVSICRARKSSELKCTITAPGLKRKMSWERRTVQFFFFLPDMYGWSAALPVTQSVSQSVSQSFNRVG